MNANNEGKNGCNKKYQRSLLVLIHPLDYISTISFQLLSAIFSKVLTVPTRLWSVKRKQTVFSCALVSLQAPCYLYLYTPPLFSFEDDDRNRRSWISNNVSSMAFTVAGRKQIYATFGTWNPEPIAYALGP